ncbi:MAG TPA: serine hydrolase [Candidatus Sulfomarinibacteraceae bacterium]|nr:serine hydrolase [Candidatus Sulfomarinibacteraceae bacterium]
MHLRSRSLVGVLALVCLLWPVIGRGQQIGLGHTMVLRSEVLDELRTISVSLPSSYHQSRRSYPVLYLLDANWHFPVVASQVRYLSECRASDIIVPELIAIEHGLQPQTIIAGEPGFALEDRMALHGVPGVSVALIEDAALSWVRHYGVASTSDPRPVDADTIFNVGSVSKAVTAATVLSLAQDGLIDLERPVNDQLTSWRIPDNELTRQAAVTPLRLLNHSGGVVFSPPKTYAAEDLPTLMQILEGLPPATTAPVRVDRVPGTTFQYSNAGFEVVRLLIEDVTGRSFAEVVAERVFDPIGMTHSSVEAPLPDAALVHAAMGHRDDGTPDAAYRRWLPHVAAGGLWTTAADYAAFVVDIQRSLRGEAGRVLTRASAELMVAPHDAPQYGLGVFQRGGGDGARYVSHLGDGPGFVAGFTMDVVGGRGMVVLTNGRGGIELVSEISRAIADVKGWPYLLPDAVTPVDPGGEVRAGLAGRYRVGEDGEVALELRGDELWLESSSLGEVELYFADPSTMVCRERGGGIAVVRTADGGVERLDAGLADELGRPAAAPTPWTRMAEGERTPLGLLLDGDTAEATRRYREIMERDPSSPVVAENRFNSLGYELMGGGRLDDALAVFRLNAVLHPSSANVHDSLGEALMKAGRNDEAVASYRRALELDPGNRNAEAMIEQLTGPTG